ncbi:MAG: aldehyde ferredoxin oxidoreductase family protein [Deltaproteobacteria bacterium]|nr:aldehyde ferredoxin oxidoreductase family protein [Deltaproteobacteria bacterium]
MYGYHGKFLKVDLTENRVSELPLAEDDLKKFIGGASLSAKLIYDQVKKGMDPLAPESPLIFSTGPLTATSFPMVSRYAVSGLSPLTGYWGEATSGGKFPFRLKESGYDGLIVTGRAKKPVYLHIENGTARIREAAKLWGKDIYKTQQMIAEEVKEKRSGVACIGPAGERRIRYASVMNDEGRAAGRCGLGAVMGSKNLKAVVAVGNKRAEPADRAKMTELSKQANDIIRGSMLTLAYREYGTMMYTDMGMILGDVPAKYFTKNVFPVEKVTSQTIRQNYSMGNYACLGCPIGCGREIKNFRKGIDSVDGPEYETLVAFGPLAMNFDLDSIIYANHLCNANGLDTISAGVSIAYAFYLAGQGVLNKKKAGMDLKWGDGKTVVKLLEMIIKQQGIGKMLSEGTLQMARELGRDEGEAAQVKGLEMPMHEGRAFHGLAASYATGPRGACHLKGDYYTVDIGGGVPELGIGSTGNRLSSVDTGERAAKFQSIKDLYDSLTLCKFSPVPISLIGQALGAITGWEYTPNDLLTAGDRSMTIKRAISNKLGLKRKDDKLPKICLQALKEGSTTGKTPDMNLLLKDYYKYREWDWDTGRPTEKKLNELGLGWIAEDLYKK